GMSYVVNPQPPARLSDATWAIEHLNLPASMKSGGLLYPLSDAFMWRSISHEESCSGACLSGTTAPSNPQRAGMAYMSHFRCGTVVAGTIRPPSTTCGMSTIGVSAIAASEEATTVERSNPSATA